MINLNKITPYICLLLMVASSFSCSKKEKADASSILASVDQTAKPNTLSDSERENGWQLLFDGENTAGWRGYNMKEFPDSWTIEDNSLTMTTEGMGESLDIITDKSYKSFALSLDVKLSKAANSGVIYHIKEDPKYQFPYETGPEFQIIDHQNWPTPLEDVQIMGANYAMYPPTTKPFKNAGEWNHLLLIVDGNKVTQVVNGEVVVEFEKYSDEWKEKRNDGKWTEFPDWGLYDKGHISLQNHGTRVWFRNIKLKELD